MVHGAAPLPSGARLCPRLLITTIDPRMAGTGGMVSDSHGPILVARGHTLWLYPRRSWQMVANKFSSVLGVMLVGGFSVHFLAQFHQMQCLLPPLLSESPSGQEGKSETDECPQCCLCQEQLFKAWGSQRQEAAFCQEPGLFPISQEGCEGDDPSSWLQHREGGRAFSVLVSLG